MATSISPSKDTLIFMPDISGFTNFVNNTEIEHSQHIIEELLGVIIDANILDLQVSEIEGDAILFFKVLEEGKVPDILTQVKEMYNAFHFHRRKYEYSRICHCGACGTASNLRLKFVAHSGEISQKNIKGFEKLFGKDLILTHRLLKNSIELDEYLLLTKPVKDLIYLKSEQNVLWEDLKTGQDSYEQGEIEYKYIPLEKLRSQVPEPGVLDFTIPGADTKLMENGTIIEAPMQLVFDVTSDLSFRHKWIPGLKDSDKLNGKIMHEGSTHRCLIDGTPKDPFFHSHSFDISKDKVIWQETNKRANVNVVFYLRYVDETHTELRQTSFAKVNFLSKLMFNIFFKKKFENTVMESFRLLESYCTQLLEKGEDHSSRVILPSI